MSLCPTPFCIQFHKNNKKKRTSIHRRFEPIREKKQSKSIANAIIRSDMSDKEILDSIGECILEIRKWDYGSTLQGKFGAIFGDPQKAANIRLLRVIFEQNKVLIIQNELIRRALLKVKGK